MPGLHAHAHATARHGRRIFVGHFDHHRLRRDQQPGHRHRALQRRADDLGRIDHAGLDHVDVLALLGVEAEIGVLLVEHPPGNHGAVEAGILGDLADRRLQGAAHDLDADLLAVVGAALVLEHAGGIEQGRPTAGDDALLDRGLGRMHGVLDPVLLLPDLDLGGAADLDDRHAAGDLGQALLQLLAGVVGGRFFDLRLELRDPALDVLLLAGAVDDGGVVLVDMDALGGAQHVERDVLELDAEIFADLAAGGQDRDVLGHGLPTAPEAGPLDGGDLEPAAQLVDDQGGQRLALDLLSDDEQRPARRGPQLEQGQQRLQGGELLLVDEDVGIFELDDHLLGIGDEIGREIAAVELHAFDDIQLRLHALGFLDGDHAVLADAVHRLGDHVADRLVAVRRDRADLGDLRTGRHLLRPLLELFHHQVAGEVDAALEVHRVHAGGDRLGALAHDRLGEHGRGGGAVAGGVRRPGRHLAHHLGAHVLELVGKLDLFGDGDAVLGDARRAIGLVEHDVAALGPERDLDRIGQDIDAADHAGAGVAAKTYFFCCHGLVPCSSVCRSGPTDRPMPPSSWRWRYLDLR